MKPSAPSAKLLERLRVAATDLAELAGVQAGWRYVSEKHDTAVYELNGAVLPASVSVAATFGGAGGRAADYYLVKGVTTVRLGVDALLALLETPSSSAYALRMNQVFGRHFHNAARLDDLSCARPPARWRGDDGQLQSFTEDDAYTVDWLALKASGAIDAARDFTVASYQDSFQRNARGALVRLGRSAARAPPRRGDGNDRLLGVHVMTSFNFKDVPELPKSKNTDRLHFRNTGFVVEETHERGVFRLSFFLSLLPVAATLRSPRKYEKWLQALAMSVANLALQARPAAPTPAPVAAASARVAWKDSDHCMLCLKAFYAFRRCHHCRFCGEAVCNKCSGFVDTSRFDVLAATHGTIAPAALPSDHYTETRGCTRCIRSLLDDLAVATASLATTDARRSSTTGSHHSKLSGSLILSHESDDEISLDGSFDGNMFASQHSRLHSSSTPPLPITKRGVAVDDQDDLAAPSNKILSLAMLSKPPLDPKASISRSTVSTTYSHMSYEEQLLRGSAASQESRFTQNLLTASMPPMRDHRSISDSEALTGFAQLSLDDLDDLHDDEVDIDGPPIFARSMVSAPKPPAARPTAHSVGGYKFSMLPTGTATASHAGEPELEPYHESFAGVPATHFDDVEASSSASALFSASAGPRLHSQKFQSLHLPPRHQASELARMSSSSGSSRASDDMILLPKAPKVPEFVVFNESTRESIFVRPGDGSDMIPLQL